MADTPGLMPALGENTTVRFKLGMLVTMIVGLLGGAVWLTNMYNRQVRQEEVIQDIRSDVREIKAQIKSMSHDRFGFLK